jgi:outer membrane protein assembly factor BamE (lipoprotein component of BamABCDE complex)
MKNASYTIAIIAFITCLTSCTTSETKTTPENTIVEQNSTIHNRLIMPEKI